jgi:hypothetical protein
MTEETPRLPRELEAQLIARALRDDAFRQQLIEDPKAALQAELDRLQLDVRLPETMRVKVLEEDPDTLYLILPPSLKSVAPPSDDVLLAALQSLNLNPSQK